MSTAGVQGARILKPVDLHQVVLVQPSFNSRASVIKPSQWGTADAEIKGPSVVEGVRIMKSVDRNQASFVLPLLCSLAIAIYLSKNPVWCVHEC